MKFEEMINQVIQGDSLEIMKQMPDKCVDLVVTSPPYGDIRNYDGYTFNFKETASELFRIIKDGGVAVWVVGDQTIDGNESGESFRQALFFKEVGFNLHDTTVYHKHSMPLTHKRYEQHFEYVFVLSKGAPTTFNPLMEKCRNAGENRPLHTRRHDGITCQPLHTPGCVTDEKIKGNIWFYDTGYGKSTQDRVAHSHPAIFPGKLVQDHILSWSNKGDIVLDPFSGSGTTCKMAKEFGRHWIGIEINPEYIRISNERMKQGVLSFES